MTESKGPFASSGANPEELLKTFSEGRIGELITAVIGADELQKKFESADPETLEANKGKPSGIIALELGIVSKDAKNALLVVQAAARTVAVAEGKVDKTPLADDVFKFVGSDRDPELLQQAQAHWQIANGVNHDADSIATFKAHASRQMAEAAKVIEAEGLGNEADKIRGLAAYVTSEPGAQTPNYYAANLGGGIGQAAKTNLTLKLHRLAAKSNDLASTPAPKGPKKPTA